MKIHTDFSSLKDVANPVVTIGTFDGVHPGHLHIINKVNETAKRTSGESVLLTFYPHPRMVLHPEDHHLKLLNTPEEKSTLLAQAGIQHLMIYPFSIEFSRQSAFDYVRDLLVNGIKAKTVVVGYDHRFGRNREGDHTTLIELAETFGFEVEEIPPQTIDEVNISSTKIRQALAVGQVNEAAKYLGRPYSLGGEIVHGDKIGRQLGFPTANIRVDYPYKLVPAHGVYAVKVLLDNRKLAGVMNIGIRPTTHSNSLEIIEVYIIDFDEEVYGKQITVEFVERLRDEKKFGSIDELKKGIAKDIAEAKKFF